MKVRPSTKWWTPERLRIYGGVKYEQKEFSFTREELEKFCCKLMEACGAERGVDLEKFMKEREKK